MQDVSALGIENVLRDLETPRLASETGSISGWSGSFRGSVLDASSADESGEGSNLDSSNLEYSGEESWTTEKSVESVSFYTSVDAASGSQT